MHLVNVDELHRHTPAWKRLVVKTLPVTHGFEKRLLSVGQSHTRRGDDFFKRV
jgi:hypothetical protein